MTLLAWLDNLILPRIQVLLKHRFKVLVFVYVVLGLNTLVIVLFLSIILDSPTAKHFIIARNYNTIDDISDTQSTTDDEY